jgi:hypothetical protein
MLSLHLRLYFPSGFLPPDFRTKSLNAFFHLSRACYIPRPFLVNLIALMKLDEDNL